MPSCFVTSSALTKNSAFHQTLDRNQTNLIRPPLSLKHPKSTSSPISLNQLMPSLISHPNTQSAILPPSRPLPPVKHQLKLIPTVLFTNPNEKLNAAIFITLSLKPGP
uniref:Uncharacterized protein n=1 Tax=Opuntia streptacantha TaxID=393608 RepID=A0A7C9D9C8_OPUST